MKPVGVLQKLAKFIAVKEVCLLVFIGRHRISQCACNWTSGFSER